MDQKRESRKNNTPAKKRAARSSSSSSSSYLELSPFSKSLAKSSHFQTLKRSTKQLAQGDPSTCSKSESDSSVSSDSCAHRGSHRFSKRSKKRVAEEMLSTSTSGSETSSSTSSKSNEQRKLKLKKSCERKQDHKKRMKLQPTLHQHKIEGENNEKKRKSCSSDVKGNTQEKYHSKKKKLKKKARNSRELLEFRHKVDDTLRFKSQANLQVMMEAREHQKAVILQSAEVAKAKLASGELQRARLEQMRMQRLYGSVDWRAKKKLKTERQRLERTLAAGRKLASMEEREIARMDAFRVALGLPTAEAQRQAEWRAEATRALDESRNRLVDAETILPKSEKKAIMGPHLPHM